MRWAAIPHARRGLSPPGRPHGSQSPGKARARTMPLVERHVHRLSRERRAFLGQAAPAYPRADPLPPAGPPRQGAWRQPRSRGPHASPWPRRSFSHPFRLPGAARSTLRAASIQHKRPTAARRSQQVGYGLRRVPGGRPGRPWSGRAGPLVGPAPRCRSPVAHRVGKMTAFRCRPVRLYSETDCWAHRPFPALGRNTAAGPLATIARRIPPVSQPQRPLGRPPRP